MDVNLSVSPFFAFNGIIVFPENLLYLHHILFKNSKFNP